MLGAFFFALAVFCVCMLAIFALANHPTPSQVEGNNALGWATVLSFAAIIVLGAALLVRWLFGVV